MFCLEHEGHNGPNLHPLWETVRPIRDRRGLIAYTDSELNLMIVFVTDTPDGSEPILGGKSWFYARFDSPSGSNTRIWRQRDKLLVAGMAGVVDTIPVDAGTIKQVRKALFDLDKHPDRALLNELDRLLDEEVAARVKRAAQTKL